jgi:TonB family protein
LALVLWLAEATAAHAGPPVMVAPNVGTGQRKTDVTKHPNRPTLPRELQYPGATFWGLYKACVSPGGRVTSVEVIRSSGNPSLDRRWMGTVRRWRHRPYHVGTRSVAYCYPVRLEIRVPPTVASNDPVTVAPNVGVGQRISNISVDPHRPTLPDDLSVPGRSYWGLFKACVSETGATSGVEVLHSTDNEALDARWTETIRGWSYQPYRVYGRAVAFCYPMRLEVRVALLDREPGISSK